MKKSMLAAILVATTLPAMAGEPLNVPFNVTVMKGNELISTMSITAIEGIPAPIEVSRLHPYRASAVRGEDGKIVITPGKFKTGVMAQLTPKIQKDGNVEADITFDIVDLVTMNSIESSDGLTVDAPEVTHTTLKQTVVLSPNTPTTLNSGDYTVKVQVNKI